VTNLRKAKSLYISRQQEYDKLKEQQAAKASETETQSLAAAVAVGTASLGISKSERKKKQEDEALHKVYLSSVLYILTLYTNVGLVKTICMYP